MGVLNVGSSTIVTPQVYALGILVSTEKKALWSKERKRRIDEAMRQRWRHDGHNKW